MYVTGNCGPYYGSIFSFSCRVWCVCVCDKGLGRSRVLVNYTDAKTNKEFTELALDRFAQLSDYFLLDLQFTSHNRYCKIKCVCA